jgi:hypothetical protein
MQAEKAPAGGLSWRSHPVVDDFPRSVLLVAAVAASCVAAGVCFGGAGYGLLAAALLGGSFARYFVPTRYELNRTGVSVRFLGQTRAVAWGDVRRVSVHREGVHLSPFEQPSRLDSFRGTFLRFAGNAEEVVSFVREQAAAAR